MPRTRASACNKAALTLRRGLHLRAVRTLLVGRRKPRIEARVMAPDVAVKLFLARAGEYAANLTSGDFLHRADLGRDPLQLGGLFQRECRDGGVLDRITTDRNAVILEYERDAVTNGVATHAAPLRRVDLPVEVQDRHLRREDRTAVADRQDVDAGDPERGGIGRMGVHH